MSGQAETPWCSCGSRCATHGVIAFEDRLAAFEAGRVTGVIEGRVAHLNDLLDVQALRQAADLLNGVVARTLAHLTGPEWAALQGDHERPEVTR